MSIPSASGSQPAGCSDFANRSTPVRMPRMDDIEIERLLTSGTHAELLIGHAQAFVGKGDWLDIEAITLVSPPVHHQDGVQHRRRAPRGRERVGRHHRPGIAGLGRPLDLGRGGHVHGNLVSPPR